MAALITDAELLRLAEASASSIERALNMGGRRLHPDVKWSLRRVRDGCRVFRLGYPIVAEEAPTSGIDRTQPLLSGPLFTSDIFPWPSVGNRWLEPIAQIDLDTVGITAGVPLGFGLLQVWMDDTSGHLRMVPTENVKGALLTPVPPEVLSGHVQNFFNVRWNGASKPSWAETSFLIKYTEAAVLYPPWSFEATIHNALDPSLPAYVRASLLTLLEALPDNWREETGHLFGNFSEVQYDAIDRPPTLLAFEGDMFSWGDGGSAQIFYELKPSGPRFSFEWSS